MSQRDDFMKRYLPVAPHKLAASQELGTKKATTAMRVNSNIPTSAKKDPVITKTVVPEQPKLMYTATADFRYNHWRRIEEKRIMYSLSGVKLSEASKFRVELTKYLDNDKDQEAAVKELIQATGEFGYVAPEPCVERWIDTDNMYVVALQNFRIHLFNLYLEHSLLAPVEKAERQLILKHLCTFTVEDSMIELENLMTTYKYGMFAEHKKFQTYRGIANKKQKKRTKAITQEANGAILH